MKKKCSTCKELKPLDDFRNEKAQKYGKGGRCKPCDNKYNTEHKKKTGFHRTERSRLKQREYNRRGGKNTYENRREYIKTYTEKNKDHIKARAAVSQALKRGIIKKKPCADCGDFKVHAHHYAGYEKKNWLTIIWLCNDHHRQAHYEN